MIAIDQLTVKRGERTVLSEISCAVEPGSLVSVIGPNGAGKTTLLKAIAGLILPSIGCITIDGQPHGSLSRKELAKKVSYLPQRIDTPYPFSVSDFISLSRYPRREKWFGTSKADVEMVDSLVERFYLTHLANTRLDALSGGELQRALIAGALAQEASYLLLDEPTASLDPLQEEHLFKILDEVRAKNNISVVVSTHNLSRARKADKCIALSGGTVMHAGDSECIDRRSFIEELYRQKA